ncbi:MAG: hypothetical protein ACI8PZ_001647 [Myxococcota bacterium]|jgi:hypothetical protein
MTKRRLVFVALGLLLPAAAFAAASVSSGGFCMWTCGG